MICEGLKEDEPRYFKTQEASGLPENRMEIRGDDWSFFGIKFEALELWYVTGGMLAVLE
jgi:hypothetical protein